jgi:hypothetical protein
VITSEQTDKLWPAFFKAQRSFKAVSKGGKNDHFKSKYSTLGDTMDSIDAGLEENGLIVLQDEEVENGTARIVTRIVHAESGQWLEGGITFPFPATASPQVVGSLVTYGRRYGLAALCCLVSDDDDGNAASSIFTAAKQAAGNLRH